MAEATPLQFLTSRSLSPAALREGLPLESWPSATRRALSAGEREWLELLPTQICHGVLYVDYEGHTMPHEPDFFRLRVEAALTKNTGRVERGDGGELVVWLPNGKHTVLAALSDAPPASIPALPVVRDTAARGDDAFLLGGALGEPAKVGDTAAVRDEPKRRRVSPERVRDHQARPRSSFFSADDNKGRNHAGRGCPKD